MANVLFVSHSKRGAFYYNDASARYRCVFPAEHLNEIGTLCHVVHFTQLGEIPLHKYSHVIFHRPQFSLKLKYYLHIIKRLNIRSIADFDDLLFNPKLASQSAAVQAGYMSPRLAKKHASAYFKALTLFTHCWVSTTELAKQVKVSIQDIEVTVCYNQLPARWASLQAAIPSKERLTKKIIRYMPGTSHHKHDFDKIEQLLIKLLRKHPDIKLEIVGDLHFNTEQFPADQISQQSHMTFEQLPSVISSSWLTLAPLQSNIFNQCKSGLKFWESGLYGVPVISSLLPDIARFKNTGLCLSHELSDWIKYIEQMKQPAAYKAACLDAYKHAEPAIFSLTSKNNRLDSLEITPENSANENPEKSSYKQQLIMCAQFGPRWPAICINPTDQQYKQANERLRSIVTLTEGLTDSEIKNLKKEGLKRIKEDTPTKKHKLIRKAKKLWNSPYDFFKDIKF